MRVLVIADNLLARTGLSALLSLNSEIDVVGQIAPTLTLADDLDIYRPDAILYDLGYNPLPLIENLDMLVEIPVVVLIPTGEYTGNIAQILGETGAFGILLRDSDTAALSTALMTVCNGLVVLDPALAADFITVQTNDEDELSEELTPREFEVLQLLAEGLPNKQIARELEISPNTVKFHINAILSKLNARSRTEAVVRATRLGLIIL